MLLALLLCTSKWVGPNCRRILASRGGGHCAQDPLLHTLCWLMSCERRIAEEACLAAAWKKAGLSLAPPQVLSRLKADMRHKHCVNFVNVCTYANILECVCSCFHFLTAYARIHVGKHTELHTCKGKGTQG